jgi:hypothetical protein
MIVQWIFFLIADQVPELETAPFSIATHLIAELSTAVELIISGIGLMRIISWARASSLVA